MSPKRILLAEDEKHIAEGIMMNLKAEGFDVLLAEDGPSALDLYKSHSFDLIILDIMLPGMDGLEICKRIRADLGTEPVLFLTARNSLEDKKQGLAIGADDYITKPFDLEELILRIRSIFRRQAWLTKSNGTTDLYEFSGGKIDFKEFTIESQKGEFHLTNKESLLLKYFTQHPNEILSRDIILDAVWGYSAYPSTRTIDNFILRFRKYFEPDTSKPIYFHTEFGTGYKFTPEGKE